MEVKVLGTGCAKCKKLFAEAEKAVSSFVSSIGIQVSLTKVEKIDEIMKFGVMMTPALVIDGEVKCSGCVPRVSEIASWLEAAAAKNE